MKKNRIYIVLLIVLVIPAIWFIYNNSDSTIKKELRDFAIRDTASVTKIFMVNKNNKSITLERVSSGIWQVNSNYIARKDAIDVILKTLKRIDVKSPVSKASFDNVVKNLAATNIKVEVYTDDDEPEKVFYVGGPTKDQYGTYMMLENSSTPFIMHIPGFNGYLSSRFFLDQVAWRDTKLFQHQFNDIKKVRLDNIKEPAASYIAINNGNNIFSLTDLDRVEINDFDTLIVKHYLALFKKVNFERIATEISESERDSIFGSEPIYRINLTDSKEKVTTLTAYLRPTAEESIEKGTNSEYDLDRMYGRINNDNEVVIIQYFVFDPLFLDLKYFLKRK